MKAYRIALSKYNDTSGEGAKIYGGRWNLRGYAALYAGANMATCLLERLTIDPELFSSERYVLYDVMEMDVPDHLVWIPEISELPKNWNNIPPLRASQEFGTRFLTSGGLCLSVPSVVDPTSLNFLINPLADHFHLVKYQTYPLSLDPRIVKQ